MAYVLQFVFPAQPDAGTVVLLLDGAVEVGAHSGQAGRGLPRSALQPHLLEALALGRGGEPLAPAFHLDMTRQRPGGSRGGEARARGAGRRRRRGEWGWGQKQRTEEEGERRRADGGRGGRRSGRSRRQSASSSSRRHREGPLVARAEPQSVASAAQTCFLRQ